MAESKLSPLQHNVALVNPDGTPTPYFIQLLQQLYEEKAITDAAVGNAIIAGAGLSGGGDLASGPVTLSADVQAILNLVSTTRGAILYRGAAVWSALLPGAAGQVLTTGGAGADPAWAAGGGGGGGSTSFSKVDFPIDAVPAVPNAFDDEFLGAVLGGAWSWVNQGPTLGQTASAAVKNGLLRLGVDVIPNANQNTHMVVKAIPAGDFDIITKCRHSGISTNYQSAGLALYSNVSGKFTENKFMYRSAGVNYVGYADWASPTGGVPSENNFQVSAPFWYVRWRNVGGNLTAYSSPDGFEWSIVRTQTIAGGYVANPTHVGLLIDTENVTWKSQSIYYWIRNYGAAGYVEP